MRPSDHAVVGATQAARLGPAQVAGLVAGNVLEFYDFAVFAFFAPQIGASMFVTEKGADGLLPALATFAVGFLARPAGAAIIGRYADTAGRKPAMMLSFGLMGSALVVLALTPPASVLGVWSAVILVVARLVQGFALGGEVGPTTSLLIEAAPPHRRGLYGSWQIASQGLAVMLAGLVGLAIASFVSPAQLVAWGWRAAFLLGAVILPIGVQLRRLLPETFGQVSEKSDRDRGAEAFGRVVVVGFALTFAGTVTNYTLQYMSTYSLSVLKLSPAVAFSATAVTGLTLCGFGLAGGHLSDLLGRRPLILVPRLLLLVLIYPVFVGVIRHPTTPTLLASVAVLTSLYALCTTPSNVSVAEGLPRARRSTAYALTYTVAVSVFGGGAQFCIAWLIRSTGSRMVPAWWLIGASLAGVAAGLVMPLVSTSRQNPLS